MAEVFLVAGEWERCGSLKENECVLIQRELILCTEKLVLKPQLAPWESRGVSPPGQVEDLLCRSFQWYNKVGLTLGLSPDPDRAPFPELTNSSQSYTFSLF